MAWNQNRKIHRSLTNLLRVLICFNVLAPSLGFPFLQLETPFDTLSFPGCVFCGPVSTWGRIRQITTWVYRWGCVGWVWVRQDLQGNSTGGRAQLAILCRKHCICAISIICAKLPQSERAIQRKTPRMVSQHIPLI